MARGVTQDQVTRAADALLARGERPTIEKVRAQLGTGSPNTLLRMLEVWWADLAKRLTGETRLPGLPVDVASAFKTAWTVASEQAAAMAEQSLAQARQSIELDKASLAAEQQRCSADLESARAEVASARDAQAVAEQRLKDHQRLIERLQIDLGDVKAQRDNLQEQAEVLTRDLMRLAAKLEKQEKDHLAERASTTAHIRAVEDRAHAEVDRARAEIKVLRTMHTQAERAGQEARDAAAREHKEHISQLRAAEREASAQRARAEALEVQLKHLAKAIAKQKSLPTLKERIARSSVDAVRSVDRDFLDTMAVTREGSNSRPRARAQRSTKGARRKAIKK